MDKQIKCTGSITYDFFIHYILAKADFCGIIKSGLNWLNWVNRFSNLETLGNAKWRKFAYVL